MELPDLVDVSEVRSRLLRIFPEGAPQRNYCVREMAAKTVFTMLYIGATQSRGVDLAPVQVVRMSDAQAALRAPERRLEYAAQSREKGYVPRGTPWYEMNTREPIRDETLRHGLVPCGAVLVNRSVKTTASKGRYTLADDFAVLFDARLTGPELEQALAAWTQKHLDPRELKRIAIIQSGAAGDVEGIQVTFPGSGETRILAPGESSRIAKGVLEEFAVQFLEKPALVWLSESGNKQVHRDELLAKRLGLKIDVTKVLPDMILVDVAPRGTLVVFVEVVSSDGPVNEVRRRELLELARAGGFTEEDVAFVTAFMDRAAQPLRRAFDALAWNSFVWVASEPEALITLVRPPEGGSVATLRRLLEASRP